MSPPTCETGVSSGDELLFRISERRQLPVSVHLQVADRCNHACVHCYQVQGQKGELTLDELRDVMRGLAADGVMALSISGGESTLRSDLLEILAEAKRIGFALRLYTNGFAIEPPLADALAEMGLLEVHVSVYSDRADEHDRVTRVPGSLARTLAGIRMLHDRGIRVVIKTPSLALAPGASERMRALAEKLGCGFSAATDITPREDGSEETMAQAAPPESLVAEGLIDPWTPSENDAARRDAKLDAASCGLCTASVVVLPNGDVLPCTDTLVPLGNLTRRKLSAIYRDSDDAALLRGVRWRDVHGCRDCDLLLACSRCHATARQNGGDYLGPYEAACRRSVARYEAGIGGTVQFEGSAAAEFVRGPYNIVRAGVLRAVEDRTSALDAERRARHPWITRGSSGWAAGEPPLIEASRLSSNKVSAVRGNQDTR